MLCTTLFASLTHPRFSVLLNLALLFLHVSVRLFESIARLQVASHSSRQHVVVLAFGVLHYLVAALTPLCTCDADADAACLDASVQACLSAVALALFAWAQWHQFICHRILSRLRTDSAASELPEGGLSKLPEGRRSSEVSGGGLSEVSGELSGELSGGGLSGLSGGRRSSALSGGGLSEVSEVSEVSGLSGGCRRSPLYRIPHGDWFQRLAMPHYTAEVLVYVALGLAQPCNRALWLLCVWVCPDLSPLSPFVAHAHFRFTLCLVRVSCFS